MRPRWPEYEAPAKVWDLFSCKYPACVRAIPGFYVFFCAIRHGRLDEKNDDGLLPSFL